MRDGGLTFPLMAALIRLLMLMTSILNKGLQNLDFWGEFITTGD